MNSDFEKIVCVETYIFAKGKVLMHKRAEDKEVFPGYWVGPGGKVEDGEDILAAAIREVKEETGVSISAKDTKLKASIIHKHIDKDQIYLVSIFRVDIDEVNNDVFETDEGKSEWIDIEKLKQLDNVFPLSKYYFDHILNDKPGIMYTNILCENKDVKEVLSKSIDSDY